MEKLINIEGIAAPLPIINVDTDMIIPKQFLKTIKRSGLGKFLFYEMRYDNDGNENNDFILNQKTYRKANILIADDNFGCGSSREHAPWALKDFGIKVIIAPSFADIFFNNCFKNGMLPVILPRKYVVELIKIVKDPKTADMRVDLPEQKIICANKIYHYQIDKDKKNTLLLGIDEVSETMQKIHHIQDFEKKLQNKPWI